MLKFYFYYSTSEAGLPPLEIEASDWEQAMTKANIAFKRKAAIFTEEERKEIHLKSIEYCDTDTGNYRMAQVANNI
jgi:hypothetical protein